MKLRSLKDNPVVLDADELLGLSQMKKVSAGTLKSGSAELGRLLSKVGEGGPRSSRFPNKADLASSRKIGERH